MSDAMNKSLDDVIKERKKTTGKTGKKGAPQRGKGAAPKRGAKRTVGGRPAPGRKTNDKSNKAQRVKRPISKAIGGDRRFIRKTFSKAHPVATRSAPAREAADRTPKAPAEKKRLRVSNLDYNITHKDLMDLFSKFGNLTKNKIEFDDLGRSKGNAIIEYEKSESANKAIEEYDGATLDGKTLSVEFDSRKSKVPSVKKKVIAKRETGRVAPRREERRDGGRGDNRNNRGRNQRDQGRNQRRGDSGNSKRGGRQGQGRPQGRQQGRGGAKGQRTKRGN